MQAELRHFHFQTKFLWPFVAIVTTTPPPPPEVRELVVVVTTNVIKARAHNIRSGWKSILAVYSVMATDEDTTLVSLAFDTLHSLIKVRKQRACSSRHPSLRLWLFLSVALFSTDVPPCYCMTEMSCCAVRSTDSLFACCSSCVYDPQQRQYFEMLSPFFVDAVHCLLAFSSNAMDLVALAAVDHLAELGAHLARGRVQMHDGSAVVPMHRDEAVTSVRGMQPP